MDACENQETGSIITGSGRLVALTLTAGSGAAATAAVYDHRSAASGSKVASLAAAAGTTYTLDLGPFGLPYTKGLWLVLSGAGAGTLSYVEKH